MLSELRARQLGVIEDLTLVLGPGMTALTGETGAGKTLVVEAIQLLLGGRADPVLVRPGAVEAVVEGRFTYRARSERRPAGPLQGGWPDGEAEPDGEVEEAEVVLSRVVPCADRSRAYVDGRMATATALGELGQRLVDLHGQHAHQSLFSTAAQRDALDAFAQIAATAVARRREAREAVRQIEALMAQAGGTAAVRSREIELLHFQLAELAGAALAGPDEDAQLAAEEDVLSGAASHRLAAETAYQGVAGEDQVLDRLGTLVTALSGHSGLASLRDRLKGTAADLADIAADLRHAAESLEDNPARLAAIGDRRAVLAELRRKYAGPGGDLAGVLGAQAEAQARLAQLEDLQAVAGDLARRHEEATRVLRAASTELGSERRAAAGQLGRAVEAELRKLAMPHARFEVGVGDGPEELATLAGDSVTFLLAANHGEPLLPLSKVASGGELARAMLALRLVLLEVGGSGGDGPSTLVFDEVDAGIGGEAALAVGRALAELGRRYQVVVVTHLAQVAAFAQAQVAVKKSQRGDRTAARAEVVDGAERVVELSRMLSGQPDSKTARLHAQELLSEAAGAASTSGPPSSAAR